MFQRIINFLKSDAGIILMSILWGLGLASLFKKACKGRNCIVIKAPDPENIKGKSFKHGAKCYSYIPVSSQCSKNPISAD